jgi:hypothetical protein
MLVPTNVFKSGCLLMAYAITVENFEIPPPSTVLSSIQILCKNW